MSERELRSGIIGEADWRTKIRERVAGSSALITVGSINAARELLNSGVEDERVVNGARLTLDIWDLMSDSMKQWVNDKTGLSFDCAGNAQVVKITPPVTKNT